NSDFMDGLTIFRFHRFKNEIPLDTISVYGRQGNYPPGRGTGYGAKGGILSVFLKGKTGWDFLGVSVFSFLAVRPFPA
ncbi:MAG: hypothetical protein LUQ12_01585, partial [Methanoregulaceae archaeon]|nr:hypothetical protein [Methanoregulaceae archaeon]